MHSNLIKTKRHTLLLILSLIFIGAFHITTIRPGNDWGGDFGLYIEHAKNIVEGKHFVDTHYIYNPEMPFHPKNYPPVFPLLLAPVYKIFGLNLTVMKIEIVILFILSLTIFFLLLKNKIPFYHLITLILVIGLNPFIADRKDHILSDIPFILLSYLFLFFLNKKYELKKHSFWLDLSIPFLLYLSYACRNMGIVLIGVLILYDFKNTRKISFFCFKSVFIFFALIAMQSVFIKSESVQSQTPFFLLGPDILFNNFISYSRKFSIILENGFSNLGHIGKQIVFLILSLLALYGFIKQCLNKIDLPEIFTFLYPLPLLFWSQNPDVRLLLPIMPWYFYYLYIGISSKKIALPVTAAIIVTYVLFYSNITLSPWNQFDHPKAQEMFKLIKKNTIEKDIIVFDKPPVLGLMSERYSFFVKIPQPENTLFQRLKEYHATYIVLSNFFPNTKAFFLEIINKNSAKFEPSFSPSFSGDEFTVYKINL